MGIANLYSKRKKKERGEVPDVFTYDDIPQALRVQIVHILRDSIGDPGANYSRAGVVYESISRLLCREYGLFTLSDGDFPDEILANFVLREQDVERVLDALEVSFHAIGQLESTYDYKVFAGNNLSYAEAVAELNARFLEHGIGFQLISGEIIRKDSEFLHTEVIRPALKLLQGSQFHGANNEFLKAHECYRKGDTKGCLVECLKALESVLKTVCQKRRWAINPTDTAKSLLETCFQNGLVPPYLQSHYSSLRSTLESGVPTLRNKLGGHGQGAQVVHVPPHYAAYVLHMTGSAICFLVEAERALH